MLLPWQNSSRWTHASLGVASLSHRLTSALNALLSWNEGWLKVELVLELDCLRSDVASSLAVCDLSY